MQTTSEYFGYENPTFPFYIPPEFLSELNKKYMRKKLIRKFITIIHINKFKKLDNIILTKKLMLYKNRMANLMKNNIVESIDFFKIHNNIQYINYVINLNKRR